MLSFGNKEFRNLQEQVLKNAQDIQKFNYGGAVLSEFGIKVVGHLDSANDLPDASLFEEEDVGNAYAVGTETPYTLYILTRPFVAGDPLQWFNIGQFPVPGPQGETGETGEQGEQGERGASIFTGLGTPAVSAQYIAGDKYIDSGTGYLYSYGGTTWTFVGSLKGPQGAQGIQGEQGIQGIQGPDGPQGPKGDPGNSFIIAGQVNNYTLLPDPADVPLGTAYLVGSGAPYQLYVLITTPSRQWFNSGSFNATQIVYIEDTGSSGRLSSDAFNKIQSTPDIIILKLYSVITPSLGYETQKRYKVYHMDFRCSPETLDGGDEWYRFRSTHNQEDYSVNPAVIRTMEDTLLVNKSQNTGTLSWSELTTALMTKNYADSLYVTPTTMNNALSNKQNTLISSGTYQNIKTINGQSILGSGNITVATDLSNYATIDMLNTGLLGKQNTLVSGTNIKTINNNSLLGEGNLNVVTDLSDYSTTSQMNAAIAAHHDTSKQDVIDANNKLSVNYISGLANVATSGSYNDLSNKPTIPVVSYPVTDVTVDGTSVLDGTVAKITLPSAATWGNITGTLSDQTDLQTALSGKLSLSGGTLTGDLSISKSSQPKLSLTNSSTSTTVSLYENYGNLYISTPSGKTGNIILTANANGSVSDYIFENYFFYPSNSFTNLGRSNNRFSKLYLSGNIYIDNYGEIVKDNGTEISFPNKSGKVALQSDIPTVPTTLSSFTNDSGFITSSALNGLATETYVDNAISGIGNVFNIKGSVANVAALPATGNTIGDVYYVASEQAGFVWIEINNVPQWEELGPSIDLSGYATEAWVSQGFASLSDLNGKVDAEVIEEEDPITNRSYIDNAGHVISIGVESKTDANIPTVGDINCYIEPGSASLMLSYSEVTSVDSENNAEEQSSTIELYSDIDISTSGTVSISASSIELNPDRDVTINGDPIAVTADIPTAVSSLTNDAGYVQANNNNNFIGTQSVLTSNLNGLAITPGDSVSAIYVSGQGQHGSIEFDMSNSAITGKDVTISDRLVVKNSQTQTSLSLEGNGIHRLNAYGLNSEGFYFYNGYIVSDTLCPGSTYTSQYPDDLGKADLIWRDLYLGRNLTDGTNSVTVANIATKAEVSAKQDALIYSATQPSNPTTGMIWLKPIA